MNCQNVTLNPSNTSPATHKSMIDVPISKKEVKTVKTAKGSPIDEVLHQSSRSEERMSS